MDAASEDATRCGWPVAAIHTECFGTAPLGASENRPFAVELRRAKRPLPVAPELTIIDVLRNDGITVPTACLQGVCGSCKTRVLEGEVEHRDAVLSEQQRHDYACVCVCVSRAKGERLVLDC